MFARLFAIWAGLALVVPAAVRAEENADHDIPAWTHDARWYQVAVTRFRNGEPSNDPEGTLPWTAEWTLRGGDDSPIAIYRADDSQRFGGDLQGLRSRLSYLKSIGVNALYLSPVFTAPSDHKYDPADLRHVDDSLAVSGSLAEVTGETHDPATWQFSASDRLFLEVLKEAHGQGFRVVVEGVFSQGGSSSWAWKDVRRHGRESPYADWFDIIAWSPRIGWATEKGTYGKLIRFRRSGYGLAPGVEKYIFAVTRRWMDPNGDGDPSDGIDGWAVYDADKLPPKIVRDWRTYIKTINPEAILVGDLPGDPSTEGLGRDYDVVVDYGVGRAIRRFFSPQNKDFSLDSLFAQLGGLQKRRAVDTRPMRITASSSLTTGRLLFALSQGLVAVSDGGTQVSPASPTEAARERWRMAMTLHFLSVGAPMTLYGDEVGMYTDAGVRTYAPMWWVDLPEPATKSADYRLDFLALVRQLHGLRDRYAPLRHGDLRHVLLDDKRQILAFSRTLPGDEVIVVMNYGDTTQEATLRAGRPRQLIGVVTPELRPGPPHPLFKPKRPTKGQLDIPRLRLGGNRQFADRSGRITLAVKPKSIRLVLVNDN